RALVVERIGVLDGRENAGIAAAGRRIENPLPRPLEVRGGERAAVGPLEPGPQMEDVAPPVGRDVPTRGLAGQGSEGARVGDDQTLEDGPGDPAVGLARREAGIEPLRPG